MEDGIMVCISLKTDFTFHSYPFSCVQWKDLISTVVMASVQFLSMIPLSYPVPSLCN